LLDRWNRCSQAATAVVPQIMLAAKQQAARKGRDGSESHLAGWNVKMLISQRNLAAPVLAAIRPKKQFPNRSRPT